MRISYMGDSYDVVKQSLLRWLGGDWSIHPMLTEPTSAERICQLERLLRAKVISTEILSMDTDRCRYLSCASACDQLFLDPDTGLRLRATNGVRAPEYLFAHELVYLVNQRPTALTMVFDQSVGRGSERLHMDGKLRHLRDEGVLAFAYVSHACFIVATCDTDAMERARARVLGESKLPAERFLSLT